MAGGDWLGLAGAELSKRMTMAYRMRQGSADVPQYRRRQYAYSTRCTCDIRLPSLSRRPLRGVARAAQAPE